MEGREGPSRIVGTPPAPATSMPDPPPRAVEPFDVPADSAEIDAALERSEDAPWLFFNRELGDLDFNWRVLQQARDPRTPLLERVRFLAITASNLDEFFQKRVGGLKRQRAAGVRATSPDGRGAGEQLDLIRRAAGRIYGALTTIWRDELAPELARETGQHVVGSDDLSDAERAHVARRFETDLYPIVTPLAVDSGRPFPLISNLSLSLGVSLRRPLVGEDLFVRLKVPTGAGRFLEVSPGRWLPLERVLEVHIDAFFPGMEVVGAWAFRVTRNADVRRDEEEAEDLIASISEELRERRFAPVVRLEVEARMPRSMRDYLLSHLELDAEDVFESDALLGHVDLRRLVPRDRPDLEFEPWRGITAKRIAEHYADDDDASMFDLIRRRDVLVHHPYDLFSTSVQRFIEEAARDPDVLAIKQTLYRTSDESPIVKALIRAAEAGKQVAVLVEVKARFDEANNIEWGERLEAAGVHVSYGFVGLKIHTKLILVVRREGDAIRTYAHVGTGNYNATTALLYTDLGVLTADAAIGQDLVNLFHHITGYAPDQDYRELIVAPWSMRDVFLAKIEREIENATAGRPARIVAKVNGLDDLPIIRALYRASRAGVRIDLIVRGHSRLRPGVPGLSENIRVMSVIGRFLEHDRVYYFENAGDPEVFLGSADWKRRNLSDRIEAVAPVKDDVLRGRIIDILERALTDNRLAWDLHPDGRYVQRRPAPGEPERNLHRALIDKAREASVG